MKLSYLLFFILAFFPILVSASGEVYISTQESDYQNSSNVFNGKVISMSERICDSDRRLDCNQFFDVNVTKVFKGIHVIGDIVSLKSDTTVFPSRLIYGRTIELDVGNEYLFMPQGDSLKSIYGENRVYAVNKTLMGDIDKNLTILQKLFNWIRNIFDT